MLEWVDVPSRCLFWAGLAVLAFVAGFTCAGVLAGLGAPVRLQVAARRGHE